MESVTWLLVVALILGVFYLICTISLRKFYNKLIDRGYVVTKVGEKESKTYKEVKERLNKTPKHLYITIVIIVLFLILLIIFRKNIFEFFKNDNLIADLCVYIVCLTLLLFNFFTTFVGYKKNFMNNIINIYYDELLFKQAKKLEALKEEMKEMDKYISKYFIATVIMLNIFLMFILF